MDEDRLKHSIAVGRKMMEIGKKYSLTEQELQDLFLLGFNHDIGYEFVEKGLNHNVVGGNILKRNGFRYWQEVYYHGEPESPYKSFYLNILNDADMQIDKYGNDVGFDGRLEDIKSRYGEDSIIYQKAMKVVEILRNGKRED